MSNGLNGGPRRRRTAQEAREAILEAAESILLERGPVELKIQQIAEAAGISVSTTHHHFGGIAEIQAGLAKRMIAKLVDELSEILVENQAHNDDSGPRKALTRAYDIIGSPRHARLIAWLFLTSDAAKTLDLATPLDTIHKMIVDRLIADGVRKNVEGQASSVILRFTAHAIGGAVVNSIVSPLLPPARQRADETLVLAQIIGVEI